MNTDKVISILRKLAKDPYWQMMYSSSKEQGLLIFENRRNLSYIQTIFLNLMSFYSSIFMDIYMNEINESVLEDEIYEDAYMYYKNKSRKTLKEVKTVEGTKQDGWIFKRPERKK